MQATGNCPKCGTPGAPAPFRCHIECQNCGALVSLDFAPSETRPAESADLRGQDLTEPTVPTAVRCQDSRHLD